jgi:hypothetical protein
MTQTRKDALIELRDKVRAGDELDGFTVSCAFPNWKPMEKWSLMQLLEWACDPTDIRAMGAVKALHNAVLPGWFPGISQNIHFGDWYAWVQTKTLHHDARDQDPARAWLLAIFEALIEQEPDT